MALLQPMMETLRQMNNYVGSQNIQNQNAPIPRPGQPTNYQIPTTGMMTGNFSPEVARYISQDVTGFNTQAPIPGVPQASQGLLGGTTTQAGGQSQWDAGNGRLLGDTYLPPDVSTVDVGNGWYEVHHGGQRVGTLRPGGPNGRFLNDTNWQMPQPGLVGAPPMNQPGGAIPRAAQAFNASGPYGAQAMQMAGLLAQPQQPGGDGLLGGPKRGFRIPGGK